MILYPADQDGAMKTTMDDYSLIASSDEKSQDLKYIPVYCLRTSQLVQASYPRNVMGALATCPFCGHISEKVAESYHVFEPSKPLIERLERCK